MAVYKLDVLSCHQSNLIFLLFARDIEDSIEYYLIQSNIMVLARNRYIFLHATDQDANYLFPIYL